MEGKTLENLLGKQLRLTLKDLRVFDGNLHCIDSFGNLILKDVVEYCFLPGNDLPQTQRYWKLIISLNDVIKCEYAKEDDEEKKR
ncbi:uncharacterized protein MONOS_3405 [Monocercomonoides exilis]|uniref:uncharacterized protein n=1 Tax=Monocercomonoides exilis TaxID=2049356 RepID=UPI0035595E29|nr:hypothetical protein MONOS_3405 [Monocercomonoides exilis]|eukprot:MONOS_3405.1-p1 / transcript=MONOS_3405.1 / gene=MONOS_3405 / organism=Monocercomonoides_exilis_PA203 / gene_product=unspecified product / transcript_product=unspecified product / location=Mono_scaffold00080:39348-39673(+) / protein_length=84 / sequence_SO=supercontig / SO=protein_coding / is_pseudo=false